MKLQPSEPVIDEIRDVRHQISARFGHEPAKLVADLIQRQAAYRDRLVKPAAEDQKLQVSSDEAVSIASDRPTSDPCLH